MEKAAKYITIAVAVIFCSMLNGGLVYVALRHGLGSSEVASWVQAIGAIAAIVGAFAIAKSQAAEADRQRMQDRFDAEADLCRTALLISMDAFASVKSVHRKFERTYGPKMIGPERLEEVLYALRSLAAKNLTYAIHSEVLVLQRELAYTLTAVRAYNDLMPMNPERREKSLRRLQAIAEASRKLLALAKDKYFLPEATLPSMPAPSLTP